MQEKQSQVPDILSSWSTVTASLSTKAISESPNRLDKEALNNLLAKKRLPLDLFEKAGPKFEDDITVHVKWAFNNIYSVPYPKLIKDSTKIARYYHGIQHVTRAAIYIVVFANLYRKHGDIAALALTEEDIKFLQIAALLHDAAREGEGEDKWDHESAIFIYMHLTKMHADKSKAKLIAEAMANKDISLNKDTADTKPNKEAKPKRYFTIQDTSEGVSWQWGEAPTDKNIYQELLECVDCLDIIRARTRFKAKYLDFYNRYQTNSLAFEEMAHLITEARSWIETQGDSYSHSKEAIKAHYEHENAYEACTKAIDPQKHPIIAKLSQKLFARSVLQEMVLIDLTPYDPALGWTDSNIKAAVREGRVFARGIGAPSALSKKSLITGVPEYLAALELRKTLRRPGVATQTKKGNALTKDGNPGRSTSMISNGSRVMCDAGFLNLNPEIDGISKISEVNCFSGFGKKEYLQTEDLTREQKQKQLQELHKLLQRGGVSKYGSSHTEILNNLKGYDAIYFSRDPNRYNVISGSGTSSGTSEATHVYSPPLQALFLCKEYEKVTGGKLPVIEYSGLHNTVRIVPPEEFSDSNVKQMWVSMCANFLKAQEPEKLYSLSISDIKILSMYRKKSNKLGMQNGSADANYPAALQDEISTAIESERQRLIKEYEDSFVNDIKLGKKALFSKDTVYALKNNPQLTARLGATIQYALENIKMDNLDLQSSDHVRQADLRTDIFACENREFLLKDNSSQSGYLHNTQTLWVYTLAQHYHATQVISTVQERMKSIAQQSIAKIDAMFADINKRFEYQKLSVFPCFRSPSIDFKTISDLGVELSNLINFMTAFGLFPGNGVEQSKTEILDNFCNQYFELIAESFFDVTRTLCADIEYCLIVISRLQSINMLNQENQKRAQQLVLSAKDRVNNNRDHNVGFLYKLLQAAKAINSSLDIEKFVCEWLASRNIWFSAQTMFDLARFVEFVPLTNEDFFKLVINRIIYSEEVKQETKISIATWMKGVWELKQRHFLAEFSVVQLSILQSKANELFDKIVIAIAKMDDINANIELIDQIYSLLRYVDFLKIPDKVILELNERLEKHPLVLSELDTKDVSNCKIKLMVLLKNLPPEQKKMIEGNLQAQLLNLRGQAISTSQTMSMK